MNKPLAANGRNPSVRTGVHKVSAEQLAAAERTRNFWVGRHQARGAIAATSEAAQAAALPAAATTDADR